MVHAACWAHSRRRFVEATKLNQQDVASARIVAQMAKLFALDAQARDENMDHAARHALRMERAPSVLAKLKAQIEAASRTALPSSPLGKASAYTLRQMCIRDRPQPEAFGIALYTSAFKSSLCPSGPDRT